MAFDCLQDHVDQAQALTVVGPFCCVWVADFAALCRNLQRELGDFLCFRSPCKDSRSGCFCRLQASSPSTPCHGTGFMGTRSDTRTSSSKFEFTGLQLEERPPASFGVPIPSRGCSNRETRFDHGARIRQLNFALLAPVAASVSSCLPHGKGEAAAAETPRPHPRPGASTSCK